MTDKTHDALLPDDEWEEYTIRIKKDPNWPHHGTDIEFNGVRYKREDLATPHAEAVRVLHAALKRFTDEIPTGWDDDHHPFSDEVDQAYKAQAHPAVVAAMSKAEVE